MKVLVEIYQEWPIGILSMSFKNYYQILGVDRDASQQEIKKAFRQLAFRYHPDVSPENPKQAEEKFKEINEAYEVIGDEDMRHPYNYFISQLENQHGAAIIKNITGESNIGEISDDLLWEIYILSTEYYVSWLA